MRALLASVVAGLLASPASAQEESRAILMAPEVVGSYCVRFCSRRPPPVERVEDPDGQKILRAEKWLPEYVEKLGVPVAPLSESFRQYFSVVSKDGRNLLYVNLFPASFVSHEVPLWRDWRTHRPVDVCDGGPSFWGVLFDPKTERFEAPEFNGGP